MVYCLYYLLLWFVDTVAERYKRTESDKKLWEGRRASPLTPGKPTAKNSNKPHFARVQIALVVYVCCSSDNHFLADIGEPDKNNHFSRTLDPHRCHSPQTEQPVRSVSTHGLDPSLPESDTKQITVT